MSQTLSNATILINILACQRRTVEIDIRETTKIFFVTYPLILLVKIYMGENKFLTGIYNGKSDILYLFQFGSSPNTSHNFPTISSGCIHVFLMQNKLYIYNCEFQINIIEEAFQIFSFEWLHVVYKLRFYEDRNINEQVLEIGTWDRL